MRSGLLEGTLDPRAVRFVLVGPQSAGNVGAAARALKNLGFRRLDVVAPGCDPMGSEARRMAVDAADLLESSCLHADLASALGGARTVVGTTRRRGKHRRPHWRVDELAGELARLARAGELALVFGRESRGLTDAELDQCTHLVYLPSSGDYPSFNLAQAVLLVAYEMHLSLARCPTNGGTEPPAEHTAREAAYAHLETALRAVGFLHEDSVTPMMRRIRRMLGRAEITEGEARILRGVARQILWLAREAGIPLVGDPNRVARDGENGDC